MIVQVEPKKAFLEVFKLFYKYFEDRYNDIYAIFKEGDAEFAINITDNPRYLCDYLAEHQPEDLEKIRAIFQAFGLELDKVIEDNAPHHEPIGFIVGFHETAMLVGDELEECDFHGHMWLGFGEISWDTLDKLCALGKARIPY
jgi:AcrR family transcriptional regulator